MIGALEISSMMRVRAVLLMIDNYDSFTYNVVQYFGELGAQVQGGDRVIGPRADCYLSRALHALGGRHLHGSH